VLDIVQSLGGPPARQEVATEPWLIVDAGADTGRLSAYRRLRHREFVQLQGLFPADDGDDVDVDPATKVLVALSADDVGVGTLRGRRPRRAARDRPDRHPGARSCRRLRTRSLGDGDTAEAAEAAVPA
jgi:hypothetical protein